MISKYCKKLKYQRRIVLVTDGRGLIDEDGAPEISKKIKQEGIELIIVYAKELQFMPLLIPIGAWTLMTLSMVSRKRTRSFRRFEAFFCYIKQSYTNTFCLGCKREDTS